MKSLIYWFRQDLRLTDSPALAEAAATGARIIPCYILDDAAAGAWAPGAASRWWLHHSLVALDRSLRERGGSLLVRRGDTAAELAALVRETGAASVFCNEAYEPWARTLERQVGRALAAAGAQLHTRQGNLLFHPDAIRNGSGDHYRVFTPFWRSCLAQPAPPACTAPPGRGAFAARQPDGLAAGDRDLLPREPDWAAHWPDLWRPGESGASAALQAFIGEALDDYAAARDFPALQKTSRLSPHLHFGEISPRQVWHALHAAAHGRAAAVGKFLGELGWREFCYQLLYHNPHLPERPFKSGFSDMPWLAREEHLRAWQRGRTGYPIVDAGMRELWHTGFMHNRVRMITASFLTKHLLLPWQWGERWFWDTLVDADLANNSGGWQWVAGCGADAAPYFRIFNPVLQGRKFDPEGQYVRRWVPEITSLPDRYLHAPWEAPAGVLADADVELGRDYPQPLVDHKSAREAALQAYGVISGRG